MLKQNELRNYVSHLYDEGRRTHSDLRDAELEKVTGLIMQSRTTSEQWEFINEAPLADEFLKPFTEWLKQGDKDNQSQVLMQLKQGAKLFAHRQIDELLDSYDEEYRANNLSGEVSEEDLMISLHNSDVARELNNLNRRAY